LADYFGMMKLRFPDKPVELMVVANTIPPERQLTCESRDIECRAIAEKTFRDVAAAVGYTFASELSTPKLPPDAPRQFIEWAARLLAKKRRAPGHSAELLSRPEMCRISYRDVMRKEEGSLPRCLTLRKQLPVRPKSLGTIRLVSPCSSIFIASGFVPIA
jgi:hypothetical protein